MQTRCPYPTCNLTFMASFERIGRCDHCGRLMSARSLEFWLQTDKKLEQMQSAGKLAEAIVSGTRFHLLAMVDNVRSLWNVGSIFRSCDGAGIEHLFLCGITGTPPRKEIAKTSLGAEETVPWSYARLTTDIIPALKESGALIVGLERTYEQEGVNDSIPLSSFIRSQAGNLIDRPICIIVGNEVVGLSGETLAVCDVICHLPMRGKKESLNVAVAFGVAAYQVTEALASVRLSKV